MGWMRDRIVRWLAADRPNEITTSDELDTWIRFGGASSASGITVNQENASGLAVIAACERVLSNDIAHLPFVLFRRTEMRREPARDLPLFRVLHDRPNPWQTSFQWRKLMMRDLFYRGNAYALKDRALFPRELIRLHPDRVIPRQDERTLLVTYEYTRSDGEKIVLPRESVFHLWWISDDGVTGISPIRAYRESIGDGIAIREHGSRFFQNAARLTGLLTVAPGKAVGPDQKKAILHDFEQMYQGNENARRTALLPAGMEFKPVSVNMEDAQWVESRRMTARELCGIFGIPPHKVGDLADATFSNVESENIAYVVGGLTPWAVLWEQSSARDLVNNDPQFFVKFNLAALLRGDAKSRAEALQIERRNGIINANEWRALNDLDPRDDPGGDEYIVEKNMRVQGDEAGATPAQARLASPARLRLAHGSGSFITDGETSDAGPTSR